MPAMAVLWVHDHGRGADLLVGPGRWLRERAFARVGRSPQRTRSSRPDGIDRRGTLFAEPPPPAALHVDGGRVRAMPAEAVPLT